MVMRMEDINTVELPLQPVDVVGQVGKAIDDASDELRRLNLEVCAQGQESGSTHFQSYGQTSTNSGRYITTLRFCSRS
jgi:hypothetical protein